MVAPTATLKPREERRLHLVVADDDPLLRAIAPTRFAAIAESVRTAADGRDALEMITSNPPDLLLLDLDMPHVNGFDVLRSMRENVATQKVPVIVVTGRGDSAAIERAFFEGASSFVTKPIHWDLLVHQINFVWRAAENEEELKRAVLAAGQASQAKSRFLASASHELRTPLNAIIGFSELLLTDQVSQLNSRAREYLRDVRGSGLHLLELINRILDIAKLDIGSLTLCRAPVNLVEIIEEILSETVIPQERKVAIEYSAPPDLKLADGDSHRLKQALENVISNAVKFSGCGDRVDISLFDDAGNVVVEVADNGIGMNAEEVNTALEPFTQVDGRLERKYDGLGIGLSIAQRLVALHGGKLSVSSKPGSGTIVAISLPTATV